MSRAELHCPEWCVADHSNYGPWERARGDLVVHLGETDGKGDGAGFTIQIGDESPRPFTIQRVRLTAPDDGAVHQDGYEIGDHFMTRDEALELAERTLDAIRGREVTAVQS